jgi:N-acetylglucosaminyldiphosphoundecaprenol N-acetyl-beta-D-mannosaminyltransferase
MGLTSFSDRHYRPSVPYSICHNTLNDSPEIVIGANPPEPIETQFSPTDIPIREFLGVRLHAITAVEMVAACDRAIRSHQQLRIGVVNAAKIVKMRKSRLLHDAVMSSDVVAADGMSVVWASRLLRQPLPERVNGTDLFENLLALADKSAFGVYLLGAREEVLDEMCRRIHSRFPNLRIAGRRNGYFSDAESSTVADDISNSGADMLFVGITSPKKEIFMAKYGEDLNVPVVHGVGGSFDVLAGLVKRAPVSWQKAGFEWLYRVIQEPGRMWKRYLVTNSIFVWLVISELVVGKRRRGRHR